MFSNTQGLEGQNMATEYNVVDQVGAGNAQNRRWRMMGKYIQSLLSFQVAYIVILKLSQPRYAPMLPVSKGCSTLFALYVGMLHFLQY